MKTQLKIIKWVLFTISLLILTYLLTGIILSLFSTNPEDPCDEKDRQIFISSNGIHLDIIIPRKLLDSTLQTELEISADVNFVSFGWGDKAFYLETPTWSDLKPGTTFKAIFLNSESAMHVSRYYKKYDDWHEVRICQAQLESLTGYLNQSFERDQNNKLIHIADSGYTAYDTFYEATGSFNGINTCNEWVNKGLKTAKVRTSVWSPFDLGVLYQIRKSR